MAKPRDGLSCLTRSYTCSRDQGVAFAFTFSTFTFPSHVLILTHCLLDPLGFASHLWRFNPFLDVVYLDVVKFDVPTLSDRARNKFAIKVFKEEKRILLRKEKSFIKVTFLEYNNLIKIFL